MIITKRIVGKAIATWLGPTGDAARRAVTTVRERVTGTPPGRLDFYFDLADPWSYLAAQAVDRLLRIYPVEFTFTVVTPPAADVSAQPKLRQTYGIRDCIELARYWDLDFPDRDKDPDAGMVRDVGAVLIRDRPAKDQLRAALDLGAALWATDKKRLLTQMGTWGSEAHGAVLPILNANYNALRKAGHYQGGMIHYRGQWYSGIDRLPYLEAALAREVGGGAALGHVVRPRPEAERGPLRLSKKPLTAELWFSFRSPYSYLALEQIEAIVTAHDVPLVLRPIAPMVDRGIPLPAIKRTYLMLDAKREADRLGIPFGEVCDPHGVGVDHCLAIAQFAQRQGGDAALAFARSAMRGIWAEARDLSAYVDLRFVVERAGLDWADAKAALGTPDGAKAAAANALDLTVVGLWGVPAIRCGDLVTWGQDRLPLLADRLRRHAAALALPEPVAADASPTT
jgi:2-hydroxychromene-2-carboxylate isomerase